MISQRSIQLDETSLNVATTGAGPPMVLLHGVTRAWQDFSTIIPALAARWGLVAPDLRGHGRSARMAGAYRVVDYIRDISALIERHVDAPAIVYGHSLGAMIALAIAAERPGRVRGLILEDPPFETMGARIGETALLGYFQQLQRLAKSGLTLAPLAKALADVRMTPPGAVAGPRLGDLRDAATLRLTAACLAATDPEVLAPIVEGRWLHGFDLQSLLKRVQCPVLLIQGDRSLGAMLSDDDAQLAQERLADCTHVTFANVGHQIHWQQPETTLRVISGFAESLELSGPRRPIEYADPIPKRYQ